MILIITATTTELEALDLPKNCATHICGIGSAQAGVEIMWALNHYKPQLAIMVGIAGKYAHSSLCVGDSVLIKTEITQDCGAFYGSEFRATMSKSFSCPLPCDYGFTLVDSATVNVCSAPFLTSKCQIENMEGAAFFAAATRLKVPFLELRTISNTVSANREDWNRELAFKNMNLALKKLLHALKS